MVGGTGAPPIIVRLREATDKATNKLKGDEATGAASSPLVFECGSLSLPVFLTIYYHLSTTASRFDGNQYRAWPVVAVGFGTDSASSRELLYRATNFFLSLGCFSRDSSVSG